MTTTQISMGVKARDKITGFEGIVTGRCDYLYGCTQWGITPPAKDGETKPTNWFDEGRVEYVDRGILPEEVRAERRGPGEAPTISNGRRG